MALFRRKKTDEQAMPPELQNYYQAENRERTWLAWLLAIATLFVTVLVVLSLFFGGRWSYRKLRHNNNGKPVAVQTTKPAQSTKAPATSSSPTSPSTSTPPKSSTSTPPSSGTVAAPTTTNGPAATTPVATNTSNLPNTGPGNTLAIFIAVSVLAYVIHRRFSSDSN